LGQASGVAGDGGSLGTPAPYVPPVLRESQSPDTTLVTLPAGVEIPEGPRPVLRYTTLAAPSVPAAPASDYPADFVQDSPAFLQSHLNEWDAADAARMLGEAIRQRPSFDDDGKPNGAIYAFADPLHHYREFELDFDGDTAKLRTVFVYPLGMSWKECKKAYGASVTTTDAGSGRTFYSYLNRRLDVLVDALGNVISLGIY
jgi:hypothetical protein